jgi:hypothetical protein
MSEDTWTWELSSKAQGDLIAELAEKVADMGA